jgi:hypothetical protein
MKFTPLFHPDMIGGLRNFTAKEDIESGTQLRLVAPKCSPVAAAAAGPSPGFSSKLLHPGLRSALRRQTCGAFVRPLNITKTLGPR